MNRFLLTESIGFVTKGVGDVNVSIEAKKKEAVIRMKEWGIFEPTIKQFEDEGVISQSEPPMGGIYWLDEEQLKRVREFEEKNNALVYHVIHSFTTYGEMESYLYVTDYEEEWPEDHEDIKAGQQLVYVYNRDMPDCSEFGSIGIARTSADGLLRRW